MNDSTLSFTRPAGYEPPAYITPATRPQVDQHYRLGLHAVTAHLLANELPLPVDVHAPSTLFSDILPPIEVRVRWAEHRAWVDSIEVGFVVETGRSHPDCTEYRWEGTTPDLGIRVAVIALEPTPGPADLSVVPA